MSRLFFKLNRAGDTSTLRAVLHSEASHGALSPAGLGPATYPTEWVLDAEGFLPPDAQIVATPVGVAFVTPPHRLTVYRGSEPISSVTFHPVETSDGEVNVLTLIQEGRGQAATPEQLQALATLLTDVADRQDANDARQAENDRTVTAIAVTADTEQVTNRVTTPGASTWTDYPEWAMRGWGSPAGSARAGNTRTTLTLRQVDAARPITQVTLRYRQVDGDHPAVVEVTRSGLTVSATDTPITFDHAALPAGALWVEFETNGKSGLPNGGQVYPTAQGYPLPRYISLPVGGPDWAEAGADSFSVWVQSETVTTTRALTLTPQMEALVREAAGSTTPAAASTASLTLPSHLYAVVGREANVYLANILDSEQPASNHWIRVESSANRGRWQSERWTLTPAADQVGTSTLTFRLMVAGAAVSTQASTLHVIPATAGANTTRKLLVIGDSTTDYGVWLDELLMLADADPAGFRLTLAGTRPALLGDAAAGGQVTNYSRVRHEAVAGTTTEWAFSDPDSVFTFGGSTFDFAQYLSTTGQALAAGDWVLLNYGINDMLDTVVTTDAQAETTAQNIVARYNTMIGRIQTAAPGVRVGVCETIPPSASQDAFGENYGVGRDRQRYMRNHHILRRALKAAFEGREAGKVWFVPLGSALDTVNNMSRGPAQPVNAASTIQVQRQDDALHPARPGYKQEAGSVYAFLKGQA